MRCRRLSSHYTITMQISELRPFEWKEKFKERMAQPCWRPSADVYETDQKICLTLELAGVNTKEIDIALYDNALVIEGIRRLPPKEPAGCYQIAEIQQGPFRLELFLPVQVNPEKVEAFYEQGLLMINLEKVSNG